MNEKFCEGIESPKEPILKIKGFKSQIKKSSEIIKKSLDQVGERKHNLEDIFF